MFSFLPYKIRGTVWGGGERVRKTAEQSMVRKMAVGKVGWKRSRIIPSEFHSFRHKFNFSFFFSFFSRKKIWLQRKKKSVLGVPDSSEKKFSMFWDFPERNVRRWLGTMVSQARVVHIWQTRSECPARPSQKPCPKLVLLGHLKRTRSRGGLRVWWRFASCSGKSRWCKRAVCRLSGPRYPVKYASVGENTENSARLCSPLC